MTGCINLHPVFSIECEKCFERIPHMISTQKLLNCLNEIKEITKLELALFHDNGKLAAATMSVGETVGCTI